MYYVAACLKQGGMSIPNAQGHPGNGKVVQAAVPEKEALAKVFSAYKGRPGERNFAQDVVEWVLSTVGAFTCGNLNSACVYRFPA